MARIILTKGLPASGKSTWAKHQVACNPKTTMLVDRDGLRQTLFNHVCLDKREDLITDAQKMIVRLGLQSKRDVYIHDTNLNPATLESWEQFAKTHNAKFVLEDFTHVPLETCIIRDRLRGDKRVGQAVIQGMALKAGLIDWSTHGEWVIFDMDGTLADISWRGPFDYTKVELDPVREHVKNMLLEAYTSGKGVIILSGRNISHAGISTEDWLLANEIPYHHLFMRPTHRRQEADTEVKHEIVEMFPKDLNITLVVDDRPIMVRYWVERFKNTSTEVRDVGNQIEF